MGDFTRNCRATWISLNIKQTNKQTNNSSWTLRPSVSVCYTFLCGIYCPRIRLRCFYLRWVLRTHTTWKFHHVELHCNYWFTSNTPHTNFMLIYNLPAGPSGRAVWGVGLRPLVCCDRGFESHPGLGCLSVVIVVCCQVEVSATDWSFVQRSPTDCGASLYVIKKPRKRGG